MKNFALATFFMVISVGSAMAAQGSHLYSEGNILCGDSETEGAKFRVVLYETAIGKFNGEIINNIVRIPQMNALQYQTVIEESALEVSTGSGRAVFNWPEGKARLTITDHNMATWLAKKLQNTVVLAGTLKFMDGGRMISIPVQCAEDTSKPAFPDIFENTNWK